MSVNAGTGEIVTVEHEGVLAGRRGRIHGLIRRVFRRRLGGTTGAPWKSKV